LQTIEKIDKNAFMEVGTVKGMKRRARRNKAKSKKGATISTVGNSLRSFFLLTVFKFENNPRQQHHKNK
jgi:hypothetical protein